MKIVIIGQIIALAIMIAKAIICPIMTIFTSIQKIKSIVPALIVLRKLVIKVSVDKMFMAGTLLSITNIVIYAS